MKRHPNEEFIPRDTCSCLMTKTMTLNTSVVRSDFEDRCTADTAIFHCLCTMSPHGPDEDDCTPDDCRPGRSCYENEVGIT